MSYYVFMLVSFSLFNLVVCPYVCFDFSVQFLFMTFACFVFSVKFRIDSLCLFGYLCSISY